MIRFRDVDVLLSLGSNVGDRLGHLTRAVRLVSELPGITDVQVSRLYRTSAWGGPAGQDDFLNAALRASVSGMSASDLLQQLLEIECDAGRRRTVKNGPRTLDLDVLLFGEDVIETNGLTVPHRGLHERNFVLIPAADIAADMLHPVFSRSIAALVPEGRELTAISLEEEAGWHHALRHSPGL